MPQTWEEHAPNHDAVLDYLWHARRFGASREARRWRPWLWASLVANALLACWLAVVLANY